MKIAAGAQRAFTISLALTVPIIAFTRYLSAGFIVPALPLPCAGLAELAVVVTLRAWPSLPLHLLLQPVNVAAQLFGTATLLFLIRYLTSSWTIAAAIGVACTLLPAFFPALSISRFFLVFAACVVIAAMLTHRTPSSGQAAHHDRLWVIGGLLASAAVHPASTLPLAVLAGWWIWRRSGDRQAHDTTMSVLVATIVLIAGVLIVWLTPSTAAAPASISACLIEPLRLSSLARLAEPLRAVAAALGPYVLALAALGLFTVPIRWRDTALLYVGAYVLVLGTTAVLPAVSDLPLRPTAELPGGLVPLLVVAWALAGIGLSEAQRVAGPGMRGRLATVLLVALVPALQWSASADRRSLAQLPAMYRALSLARLDAQLAPVEAGDSVVIDDAAVDLLLRARMGVNAPNGRLNLAPRDPFALAQELSKGGRNIYALPLAQRDLQHVGLRLTPVSKGGELARVELGGHCYRLREQDWRAIPALAAATAFSLVARHEAEVGPVVLYAIFDQAPDVHPIDWSSVAMRGFHSAIYRPALPEDRGRLERDVRDDQVPKTFDYAEAAYVARLEQWRTPETPFVLATALGARPVSVIGRLKESAPGAIMICASE